MIHIPHELNTQNPSSPYMCAICRRADAARAPLRPAGRRAGGQLTRCSVGDIFRMNIWKPVGSQCTKLKNRVHAASMCACLRLGPIDQSNRDHNSRLLPCARGRAVADVAVDVARQTLLGVRCPPRPSGGEVWMKSRIVCTAAMQSLMVFSS